MPSEYESVYVPVYTKAKALDWACELTCSPFYLQSLTILASLFENGEYEEEEWTFPEMVIIN